LGAYIEGNTLFLRLIDGSPARFDVDYGTVIETDNYEMIKISDKNGEEYSFYPCKVAVYAISTEGSYMEQMTKESDYQRLRRPKEVLDEYQKILEKIGATKIPRLYDFYGSIGELLIERGIRTQLKKDGKLVSNP
jgi:hypothetical protein